MKKIKIEVFGGLKQYFPKQFEIEQKQGTTIGDVISSLSKEKPEAQKILNQCLVAAGNDICPKETTIDDFESLVIMPPYSGG